MYLLTNSLFLRLNSISSVIHLLFFFLISGLDPVDNTSSYFNQSSKTELVSFRFAKFSLLELILISQFLKSDQQHNNIFKFSDLLKLFLLKLRQVPKYNLLLHCTRKRGKQTLFQMVARGRGRLPLVRASRAHDYLI